MRLFPVLAAILVSTLIYLFIFERDRLTAAIAPAPGDERSAETAPPAGAGTETADAPAAPVGVVAIRSEARRIDSAVILRGRTEADRHVDVLSETAGRVISDPLAKGSFVDDGQSLCRLDPGTRQAALAEARARQSEARARVPEAEARLEEAEARLAEARINDNAAAKLSEGGFASDVRVAATTAAVSTARAALQSARSGVESARSGIEAAAAAMAAAEEEISRLDIRAPFAGVLESDSAELGSLLQPGALCATVIRLDPIMLVGFVPETAVGRVELGAPATGRLASGQEVTGTVTFLSRAADPETRTFRVEIEVANPDLTMRDGQTAEIAIAAEGTRAHLVPQAALTLNDAGDLGVRLVSADVTAVFAPVTLIRDTPEGVWLSGLPDRAEVIVIGQEYVADGVAIAPTFREAVQ